MPSLFPDLTYFWRFFDEVMLVDKKTQRIELTLVIDSLKVSNIFRRKISKYSDVINPSTLSYQRLVKGNDVGETNFFDACVVESVFSLFFFKCFVERDVDYFDNFKAVETDLPDEQFYRFVAFIQMLQFLNSFQKIQMLTSSDFWFFADRLNITENVGLGFHIAHWWLNWKALNLDGQFMLSTYKQAPELAEDDRLADTNDFMRKVFKKVSDIIKSGYFDDHFNELFTQYCTFKGIEKSELKTFFSGLFSDNPDADTYVTVALDRTKFFGGE